MDMTDDIGIYRTANLIIKQRGALANISTWPANHQVEVTFGSRSAKALLERERQVVFRPLLVDILAPDQASPKHRLCFG